MLNSRMEKSEHCQDISVDTRSNRRTSCLLCQPNDSIFLSGLFCFLRENIEAFVIKADGGDSEGHRPARQQTKVAADVGKVGVRCVHCARQQGQSRTKGAVSFPRSIRLVYQTIRNFQRFHLLGCEAMPEELKKEFVTLKSMGNRSSKDAPKYWEECCRRMGMVDTADGIRLRTGYFEDTSCGGQFSFRENAVLGSAGSMKRSIAAVASTHTKSADEREVQSGPSRSIDPDLPGVDTRIHASMAVPGAEAGVSSLPVSAPTLDAKGYDTRYSQSSRVDRDLCDRTEDNEGLSFPPPNPLSQAATMQQTAIADYKASSTAERSLNTTVAVDLCICDSLMPNQQKARTPHSQGPTNGCCILAGRLSNEGVLQRVQLALTSVKAMRQIRLLPSGFTAPTEEVKEYVYDALQHDNESQQVNDLPYLGSELYELFSGVSICKDEEELITTQQQRKKGKRPNSPGYVPLSELGLPPSLCTLVSSLLSVTNSCEQPCCYESIGDVEEDLRLMASKPERFLFQAATDVLEIAPDALYGRQEETAKLLEAYNHVTDPTTAQIKEMVLVSGYSGTGKSMLVQNVRDHFIEKGACFVSGKYDAMQRLQPLSAIVSAMDDYCVLLAENTNRIDEVREAVRSALGKEGRAILSSLIPSFDKLASPAHDNLEMPRVDGREALQQLIFVIRMLFQATCSFASPVVLFLDDLQWADEISLMLMRALVADTEVAGLMFIGCYRDNEVGEDHPLMSHLAEIRRSGSVSITSICVENLGMKSINSLLSDALHLTPQMTQSLAEAVLHKTGGNALFVVQFLSSLRDEGLLHFSLSSRRWEWDICKIREKDIADSVVALMTAKLLQMAPEVTMALKTTAALGARCQEELLHILDRAPERVGSTSTALDVAVAEGIMNKAGLAYGFAHDQIQLAAYLLIPESERAAFHLLIGRLLWKWCTEDEAETYLFVTVDQLHRGSSHISEHNEKVALARLSLMAGEMATAMSAFLPASAYLAAGIGLLNEEDWQCNRGLCFNLVNLCAETEYILGNFDAMQGHLDEVLKRGRTLQEKLRAHFILFRSMGVQGRAIDAINAGSEILDQLGESLPIAVTTATVEKEIAMTARLLAEETEGSLLQKKTMEDPEKLETMKLLNMLLLYFYSEKKSHFPVAACRLVRLSVLHGVCRESPLGFACYGMVLCGVLGKHSEGYRYGKIALSLLDRFQAKEHLARVYACVYGVINSWIEPIQACLPQLKQGIDVGLATGDTENAMLCAHSYAQHSFSAGQSLGPLMEEMRTHSKQMIHCNQFFMHTWGKPVRQTTLNLLGLSPDPTKLVGEEMDEKSTLYSVEDSDHSDHLAFSFRMWLEYLFGKYQDAWEIRRKIQIQGKGSKSFIALFPSLCNNVFCSCLTALALAREEEKAEYNKIIGETIAQMEEWAALTPWNCRNKFELMKAEYAFFKGDFISAARSYDLAVDLAVKHHFIHEQALALERYGMFHLVSGDHAAASTMFERACECYTQWGACSKSAHVRQCYL